MAFPSFRCTSAPLTAEGAGTARARPRQSIAFLKSKSLGARPASREASVRARTSSSFISSASRGRLKLTT
jgi:hypothetical protein